MRLLTVATLVMLPLAANAEGKAVKVGDKAPDFTLKNHLGKEVKLSDYWTKKGKAVLIAFYPKDFTGG